MEQSKFNNSRSGQSLIELMIAVAVGAILIGSAAVVMSAWIRISAQNKFLQAASFLSQDLMDKVAIFAERQWYAPSGSYGIYNLNKGSLNHYYLCTDTCSPFEWRTGDEQKNADGVDYTRYFYIENVRRQFCGIGNIFTGQLNACQVNYKPGDSGATDDPSTQKVTVVTSWPSGGNVTLVRYLTRNRNQVIVQTDWSGGFTKNDPTPDPVLPATAISNKFYDANSGIDYTGTPGSILLK